MELVLDASVVIKWFLLEPGYQSAVEYRKQAFAGEVFIHETEFLFFEVGNALVTKPLGVEATQAFMSDVYATPIMVHRFTQDTALATVKLAVSSQMSFYDASYLVLAQELGCPFITADERLYRAIQSSRIPIVAELFRSA